MRWFTYPSEHFVKVLESRLSKARTLGSQVCSGRGSGPYTRSYGDVIVMGSILPLVALMSPAAAGLAIEQRSQRP